MPQSNGMPRIAAFAADRSCEYGTPMKVTGPLHIALKSEVDMITPP